MTEDRLPLAELLAKAGDGDFLRSVAEGIVIRPHEGSGERQELPRVALEPGHSSSLGVRSVGRGRQ